MFSKSNKRARFGGIALSLIFGLTAFLNPNAAQSQDTKQLREPTLPARLHAEPAAGYQKDILLVMPDAHAENEDIEKAMKEVDGTVIGTLGQGQLRCLIVRTEKGKLEQTEQKLRKDKKDFKIVQKNYTHAPQLVPNDPQFASEWYIPAVNAQRAWDTTQGAGMKIAIFDSGCQASVTDLAGKTDKGFNANKDISHFLAIAAAADPLGGSLGMELDDAFDGGARTDLTGHGTMVATTAAATDNNNNNGAGIAPQATVVPIHITDDSTAQGDDLSVMAGLLNVMVKNKAKIVNISYSNMTDPGHDPAMHLYFRAFHDLYGGIIFVSAGNASAFLPSGRMSYLNVVSAVDPSLTLSSFSNFGNCVTFAAPGSGIVLTDRLNNSVTAAGTSFASPICAGIAALVWSTNPGLSNTQVEDIMKLTATRGSSGGVSQFFGFGMPDAQAAVRAARGS